MRRVACGLDGAGNAARHVTFPLRQIRGPPLDQPVGDFVNRVLVHPQGQIAAPRDADVHVVGGAHMASPAERAAFDQGRPFAAPGARNGLRRRLVDHHRVVAVHALAGHGMKFAGAVQVVGHAPLAPVHMARVLIVFTDEQERQAVERRQVQRLVNMTFFHRAVAEEGGRDAVLASHFVCHGRARGQGNGGRHDRHRAQNTRRAIKQVHGAAAARRASRGLEQDLGK